MRTTGLALTILATLFTGVAAAQIQVLNVTNLTDGLSGLPAYGSIAAVSCAGLTGIVGAVRATQYPLPTQLAGVSVSVNGAAAPLLTIADIGQGTQQITIQMPVDRTAATVPVVVSQSGHSGQLAVEPFLGWTFFFPLPPNFPYFGTPDSALVQHADYSAVTYDHPAQPGEVVMVYGTNLVSLRAMTNAPPLGFPSPGPPYLSFLRPVQVGGAESLYTFYTLWVNGEFAEVQFIGMAPGQVGVFQINFRVPSGTPDGNAILLAVSASCTGHPQACIYAPSISANMPVQAATPQANSRGGSPKPSRRQQR